MSFFVIYYFNARKSEQQAVAATKTLSLILIIHKPHFLSQSRYGVEILLFIFSTRSLPLPRLYSKSHNISSRPFHTN